MKQRMPFVIYYTLSFLKVASKMLQNINQQLERIAKPIQSLYHTANEWYQIDLVQRIVGIAQLILGSYSAYQLYQEYLKHRLVRQNPSYKNYPPANGYQKFIHWIQILGHLSYVGAALTSQPILIAWRWSASHLLSADQIGHLLRNNSPFPVLRIYYLIQLGSLILGIPSMIYTSYQCSIWISHRIQHFLKSRPFATNTLHLT